MNLRAQEILFPQVLVNQGQTLDLATWKGLKKTHFSEVLMTKTTTTDKQTCLVDLANKQLEGKR